MLEWARRIVGDARAMRQEIDALKHGLPAISGSPPSRPRWRWCRADDAVPRPPSGVRFTILSRTSIEILTLLENLEIDAGLTYLDNEPIGRVSDGRRSIASATGC